MRVESIRLFLLLLKLWLWLWLLGDSAIVVVHETRLTELGPIARPVERIGRGDRHRRAGEAELRRDRVEGSMGTSGQGYLVSKSSG